MLHLPFVVGLLGDRPPEWLATGWQVSATLVGLGVALIIFLLQAASSQSLSSQATYRALLAHTWIAWPTTFALAFVASVGLVERFGGDGPASAWANTWALVSFVVQIAALGIAFARAVEIVSPAGTRRVLRQAFADAMNRAVRDDLLRRLMVEDLRRLCDEHQLSYGNIFARGRGVTPHRQGPLVDVDRNLPRTLADFGLSGHIEMTLDPGSVVDEQRTLVRIGDVRPAWLDGLDPRKRVEDVRGVWLNRLLRNAVAIGRRDPPRSPVPIFNDALDVGRRALEQGSKGTFRDAVGLIVSCLEELPRVYSRWGAAYTLEHVYERAAASIADEILDGLAGLSDDAYRDGHANAVFLMPQLAHAMVDAGLHDDAWLLVKQGMLLWLHQMRSMSLLRDLELQQEVHRQITRLAGHAVTFQQRRLEDSDASLASRLTAQPGLRRLFAHQVEALKLHLDDGDESRFAYAWSVWNEWAQHWQPQHAVEELELETTLGDVRHQREAERALTAAQQLVEAKRDLEEERTRLLFDLGAWVLHLQQQARLSADQWLTFVPQLMHTAPNAAGVIDRLRISWTELGPIRHWVLSDSSDGATGQPPPNSWSIALRWGVLMLMQFVVPGEDDIELRLGTLDLQLGAMLLDELDVMLADDDNRATYERVTDGQLMARIETLQKAMQRAQENARKQLAQVPLNADLVASFADHQRRVYAEGDYLRQLMLRAGAFVLATSLNPADELGLVLPKLPFITIDESHSLLHDERPAKLLAQQKLRDAYNALAEIAEPFDAEAEAAEAAVQAIADLRRAGHEPDAVLLPHDVYLRALLSSHPEWSWKRDLMREEPQVATLAGVPVYHPGPADATALVICDLKAAIRRVERRHPDETSSVRVKVDPIEPARAAYLYETGARAWNVENRPNAQQAALASGYVEVHVTLDVEWQAPTVGQPAARRVQLPPHGQRKRQG